MGDNLPCVDLGTGWTSQGWQPLTAVRVAVSGRNIGAPLPEGAPGFTCVVVSNGRVKCFGDNRYGHLGLGDVEDRGDAAGTMGNALPFVDLGTLSGSPETATDIASSNGRTCVVLSTGKVRPSSERGGALIWGWGKWGGSLAEREGTD